MSIKSIQFFFRSHFLLNHRTGILTVRSVYSSILAAILFLQTSLVAESESPITYPEPPALEGAGGFRIEVDDTSTMVMIAKVFLEIGDLYYEDGHLVGSYSIEVPLRPKKSEEGTLRLPVLNEIEQICLSGGELNGLGFSFKKGKEPRKITCRVIPETESGRVGAIQLEILTGDRVLKFDSKYKVHGEFPEWVPLAQIKAIE